MSRPKGSRREVNEVSGSTVVVIASHNEVTDTVSQNASPSEVPEVKKVPMETITETRKIDKVEYSVTFPDVSKVSLTAEQTATAVKSFFAAKVGYLLRQDVKSESSTLEVCKKLYSAMIAMGESLGAPPELAAAKALEYCKSQDANFRLEPTKSYTYGLTDVFKPEKPEEKPEGETVEEKSAE